MKTLKLYRDTDTDEIYTAYDLECGYDDMISDLESDGIIPTWDGFQDFVMQKIACGELAEITAYLSDGKHVYPFYYVEEDIGVQTTMKQYIAYLVEREHGEMTFADFLDIPSTDRNGIRSWGFCK